MNLQGVKEAIERTFSGELEIPDDEFRELMNTFVGFLNTGQVRAAEPSGNDWLVNTWVKQGILLGFRRGKLKDYSINAEFRYFDKDTFPLRPLSIDSGVRLVPGGSTVRTGSYVSPGVVVMPPSYINVGAHIGPGSMVDSNVLVGSCAQIGSRVHLSAGVQIGGVLEPVGASPVIIEDDVLVGGNCGIYEGVRVRKGAVIGAGTILTAAIPVFDNVRGVVLRGGPGAPVEIPAGAVVVPGSRPLRQVHPAFGGELQMACALIVKYRDSKTEASTALEDALR